MVDRERADDLHLSPSASARATTCFVSWSAATAATTIAARLTHWRSPAPSDRSAARSAAARSSPSRRGRRAAATRGGQARSPAPLLIGQPLASSMQSVAQGTASSRSSGISLPQTSHVPYVAGLDPRERLVDLAQLLAAFSSSPSSSSRSYVSVAVSARWLSALPTAARRSPPRATRCRCRDARSSSGAARAPARAPRWKWAVSMLMRSASPVRPPWRAVARSRPARGRSARRSCCARTRPKRG